MAFFLRDIDRKRLKRLARQTKEVRVFRRAQALLDLDAGDAPGTVARRYNVARSTIYNWIRRCRLRGFSDRALRDLPRPGRRRVVRPEETAGDTDH